MKTSTLQVHDMLSVLSVDEVERRIGEVPGVASVTVDFAAGRATVRYDETRLENADIKSAVRQRGFDSSVPGAAPTADEAPAHAAPVVSPAPPSPSGPGSTSDAGATGSSSTAAPAPASTAAPAPASDAARAPASDAARAPASDAAPKPDAPAATAGMDPAMPPP